MFWFENFNQPVDWDYSILNVLNDGDIQFIEDYVLSHKDQLSVAEIKTSDNPTNYQYRRSDIMWLTDAEYFNSIYSKIIEFALIANNAHFKYSLSYLEPLQYSVYRSDVQGCYHTHIDNVLRNPQGYNRKVSFSILLNDPNEFEGGHLNYHYTDTPLEISMKKGEMRLFPSFMPHSVQPVTSGTRKSLVGWLCGPNFV